MRGSGGGRWSGEAVELSAGPAAPGLPPGWSDLKPENILLDEYGARPRSALCGCRPLRRSPGWRLLPASRPTGAGNTKLADFGLAAIYRYNGEVRQLRRICGSPPYVAPEIIDCYSGEAVDVWSCGIILLVLLVGSTSATPSALGVVEACASHQCCAARWVVRPQTHRGMSRRSWTPCLRATRLESRGPSRTGFRPTCTVGEGAAIVGGKAHTQSLTPRRC